jgi:hypothetical protein
MSNTDWHQNNPLPIYPRPKFLGWHLRHEAACGCSPISESVLQELDAMGIVLAGYAGREPAGDANYCGLGSKGLPIAS